MSPAGNGTPQDDVDAGRPPYPRRAAQMPLRPEQHEVALQKAEEKLAAHLTQAGIKGQPMPAADRLGMTQADQQPDFLHQVNAAAHLLASIGIELGSVGHDDKNALQQFATAMQENTRRYVGQLIQRKRAELADLERILGKL